MVRSSDGKRWNFSPESSNPNIPNIVTPEPRPSTSYPVLPRVKRPAPPAPVEAPKPIQDLNRNETPKEKLKSEGKSSSESSESSDSESDSSDHSSESEESARESRDHKPAPEVPKPDYPVDNPTPAIKDPVPDYNDRETMNPVFEGPFQQSVVAPAVATGVPIVYSQYPTPYQHQYPPDPNRKMSNFDKLKAKLRAPKQNRAQPVPGYPYPNQIPEHIPQDVGPTVEVVEPVVYGQEQAPVVYNPQPYSQPAQEALARQPPPPAAVPAAVAIVAANPEPDVSARKIPDDQSSQTQEPPGGPPLSSAERPGTPLSLTSCSTMGLGTIGPVGFSVAYVDFIPQMTESADNICDCKYETLNSLMIRANEWLSSCRTMKPVSFESIDFPCDSQGEVDTDKVLHEINGLDNWFLRVLRMWVTCKKPGEDSSTAVEVRHINLYPKWRARFNDERETTMPLSETLDETIMRVNEDFATSFPLSGQVLSMETVNRLPAYHKDGAPIHLDPDMTIWKDNRQYDVNFLTILRLYYIPGQPAREIIGVMDFVPELLESRRSLEPMEDLVQAASNWIQEFKGLRATNIATIDQIVEDAPYGVERVNPRKTLVRRKGRRKCHVLKVLRLYYTQKADNSPLGPKIENPLSISHKNVTPRRGQTMQKAAEKLVGWVCLSGQPVISVETINMRTQGKQKFDAESTHTYDSGGQITDYIMFGFRAYTDPSQDDNQSDAGSAGESLPASRTGSVASRDYSAWPDREIPREFLRI